MNLNPVQQTLSDMDQLYQATMELYENYFSMLKAALEQTPESEAEKINALSAMAEEAKTAMEADMAVFDKALATDTESVAGAKDELQIQDIYKKLQK